MQIGDLVMDAVTGDIGIIIAFKNETVYEPVIQVEFAKGRYFHSYAGLVPIEK